MKLSSGVRLHHLDFLRAAMMFLGVLVHASHADYDLGQYEAIRFISGSFRMPCFFIIAGFFSVMVMEKVEFSNFLKTRVVMLGVPALICVMVFVPVTVAWMKIYFHEGGAETIPHSGWMGHAWFLFVLLGYTVALGPLKLVVELSVRWFEKLFGETLSQALFFVALVLIIMFISKVVHKFGPFLPYYTEWKFLVSATISNLPYFVLGVMMYRWPGIYSILHRHLWSWITLALLSIFTMYYLAQNEITSTAQHIIYMTVSYLTACAVSAALFSISSRLLTKHNATVRLFSESAYTVYIVHYIIVAWILVELQRVDVGLLPRMLMAFLIASIVGVLIHVYVVRRFPLISLLLNGRFRLPTSLKK
jgi:glucan biosynthesis protein C